MFAKPIYMGRERKLVRWLVMIQRISYISITFSRIILHFILYEKYFESIYTILQYNIEKNEQK